MRPRVEITMIGGEKHYAAGYASVVSEQIKEARIDGETLIAIERDLTPTGQMMYLNPRQVESVKDD